MSGEDAHLFTAERQTVEVKGESFDLGLVGEITSVDPSFVETVLADGLVPVVSSVARERSDDPADVLNVNADMAASALAVALGARKLVMLTDVAGIFADWPQTSELISEITTTEVRDMLPTLDGGMVPKMQACLAAIEGGVGKAHVLDGRIAHALLLEIFTNEGIGTQVVPELVHEPALKVVK
jgi:acetylglutamate kinase